MNRLYAFAGLAVLAVTLGFIAAPARAADPTTKDHTAIMKMLMLNHVAVRKNLGSNTSPSVTEILQALLRVAPVYFGPVDGYGPISGRTRASIQSVLATNLALKIAPGKLSPRDVADIKLLNSRVRSGLTSARSLDEMIETLNNLSRQYEREGRKDLVPGIQAGIGILQDGASTIYSEHWWELHRILPRNGTLQGGGPEAKGFWKGVWGAIKGSAAADAAGAIDGAAKAIAAAIQGCGAAPTAECLGKASKAGEGGAIAGAVAASANHVLGN